MAEKVSDGMESAMGNFGRWHIAITLAASFLNIPGGWWKLVVVFFSPPVEFWCIDPAPPANWTGARLSCSVPDGNGNERPCIQWEYDRSVFQETIITQWDLVCDKSQLSNIAQMLFMGGYLVGCFLGGILADSYGRKPVLVCCCIIQLIASVATAFSPWFILFLILRFITGMAIAGALNISYVLLMEVVGKNWRTEVNSFGGIMTTIGNSTLPGVAYLLPHWRYLQLAISIPSVLFLSLIWIAPESPRWLLAKGKTEKAELIVRHIARVNRTGGDNWSAPNNSVQEKKEYEKKYGIRSLFATPVLRKFTLVMFTNWTSAALLFYGLSQYMGQLGGNIFMNVFLSGLLAPPGVLISNVLLQKCGRKKSLIIGQIIAASSSFANLLVPKDGNSGSILSSLLGGVGLCSIGIVFPACYIYTAELYPTVIRNVGMGATSTVSRIGAMVAPFIATLSVKSLPPMIFGSFSFVAGLLVFFLPETLGKDLPETIDDVETQAEQKKVENTATKAEAGITNRGITDDHS